MIFAFIVLKVFAANHKIIVKKLIIISNMFNIPFTFGRYFFFINWDLQGSELPYYYYMSQEPKQILVVPLSLETYET